MTFFLLFCTLGVGDVVVPMCRPLLCLGWVAFTGAGQVACRSDSMLRQLSVAKRAFDRLL